jgi:hypothetical protein
MNWKTTMATTSSSPSFAISYGLVGGKLHSRGLRQSLLRAGFSSTSKQKADIIIAHSAGCWLIPKNAKPKLIIYVGMPLANDEPKETWKKAVASGFSNNSWQRSAKIASKNAFYGISQPKRNLGIIRKAAQAKPVVFPNVPAVFVANHYDPWPRSSRLDNYIDRKDWTFISLEGSHDDIWDHPDRYVEIVKRYAKLLG